MNKKPQIYALIMAGGWGERFWPKSRRAHPKQLLKIGVSRVMLEETVSRLKSLVPEERIFIITNAEQAGLVRKLLPRLKNIIAEPLSKNTAGAIGLGAIKIQKENPEAVMLVLPSDHKIGSARAFVATLKKAAEWAVKTDSLVTIGIKPRRPATGYGYIKVKGKERQSKEVYRVDKFIEKPGPAKAKRFLKTGNYYWNSGMFIWRTGRILEEIETHLPRLYQGLEEIKKVLGKSGEDRVIRKVYEKIDKISIDYGVMEKADNVALIPAAFDWDDVGSWASLSRLHRKNRGGNVLVGDAVELDSKNSILVCDEGLLGAFGIEDLIVVKSGDAVLVCPVERAEEVKTLVARLRKSKKSRQFL